VFNSSSQHSIVFLDSGIGGLSYLEHLMVLRPELSGVYVADTAYFPYAIQPRDKLTQRILDLVVRIYNTWHPDYLVLACNTATILSKDHFQGKYKTTHIIGVEPIRIHTLNIQGVSYTRVYLLASWHTVEANREKVCLDTGEKIVPCQGIDGTLLVRRVENAAPNFMSHNIKEYIQSLRTEIETHSVVILGCTHFLHIKSLFSCILPDVKLVDTREKFATQISKKIKIESQHVQSSDWLFVHTGAAHAQRYRLVAQAFGLCYKGVWSND